MRSGNLHRHVSVILINFIGLLVACANTADATDLPEGLPPQQTDPGGDQPSPDEDTGGPGARAVSPNLIQVTWTPNTETDLAGYRVYRSLQIIATVGRNTTIYADRDVVPATTYSYLMTAFDRAGNESSATPEFRVTTPPTTMPPLHFASDVFPILQSQCSNCHTAFLMPSTAFTRLTAMGSGACAGRRLVIPGNALRSLLFQIATGSHDCIQPPPLASLPWSQANVIGAWINQGGLNN